MVPLARHSHEDVVFQHRPGIILLYRHFVVTTYIDIHVIGSIPEWPAGEKQLPASSHGSSSTPSCDRHCHVESTEFASTEIHHDLEAPIRTSRDWTEHHSARGVFVGAFHPMLHTGKVRASH
jgi:hypothetical protein